MTENNIQRAFFVALVLLITIAFLWLIRGFLQPIFWAIALGIVVYPLHVWLVPRLHNREGLAAGLSMLAIVVVVILPLLGVTAAVTREGAMLYQSLNTEGAGLESLYARVLESVPPIASLLERFGIDLARLETQLSEAAVAAGRIVASRALAIGQDTVRVTVFFFLMLYLLFFFLRDGQRLLEGLVRALPFGDARERLLLGRFAQVSRATIKGTLVVGIVQGTIGGTAFAVLGISAPVLWGVVMALASILPAVGPALIWLPAAVVLIATGSIGSGVILIVIGVAISLVDNVLRPILVGRDTRMPDYLILLSTLGGLAAFGLAGIVIGPIIAAFFVSVWQMAQEEFSDEESAAVAESAAATPPDADTPG